MRFAVRAGLVLLLLIAAAAPAVAGIGVPQILAALERDIAATRVHAVVLRERLAADAEPDAGAAVAGIADGGAGSSFTALRLAARTVDRRLERLRLATADALAPDRVEVLLALRASLAELLWTIESMRTEPAPDAESRLRRERQLARLDESLGELDRAATTMVRFDWTEP